MMKKQFLVFVFFGLGFQLAFSQHHLEVQINGVNSLEGTIAIALYTEEENFLNFDKAYRFYKIPVNESHTYVFRELEAGFYAIAAFYDQNSNEQLDTNLIGIPKEALGTSGNPKNKFGPPRFKNCKFYLNSDQTVQIELKKLFDK